MGQDNSVLDPGVGLPEAMALAASRYADRVALEFGDRTLTFAELDSRASKLAAHLVDLGVGSEDLVAVAMHRSVELMVGLLAVWKAGAAYVPVDPDYPKERIVHMLEDCGAQVILTQSHVSVPPTDATVVDLDTWTAAVPSTSGASASVTPDGGAFAGMTQLAYVIYTSGSTGRPKGAMIEHRSIANRLAWMQQTFSLGKDDVVLQKTPTSFDVSVWELFWSLCTGARLVLAEPGGHRDDLYLVGLITERRVTTCHFVPSMLAVFLEAPNVGQCAATLRRVICSGEALPARLIRRFAERLPGVELHNLYGPTEAAVDVSHWPVDFSAMSVPIGKAISGVALHVVDPESGRLVEAGEEGELWIGGVQVGRGYLGRDELTRERFIADPFDDSSEDSPGGIGRIYKTGDRVRELPSGDLAFLGRFDHQVKLRGFRIELGEIEARLMQHPGVREATVTLRDDGPSPRLVAYVTAQSTPEASAASVKIWGDVFDATYAERDDADEFDLAGWKSSYTGQAIPREEMRAWLDGTLARIRALKPKRVLELGCGTGMILFGLGAELERYVGLDLSAKAVADLEERVSCRGWSHVELCTGAAHAIEHYERDEFDLVIVNSVLQFFPGPRYLRSIIDEGARVVSDGGHLFFGDVRSLPHLEAFHASVERYRNDEESAEIVKTRILEAIASEEELLVDDLFFRASGPAFGGVEILWRSGRDQNEMTRFRYDAVLHVGERAAHAGSAETEFLWRDLGGLGDLPTDIDHTVVHDLPNARIAGDGVDHEQVVAVARGLAFDARLEPGSEPELMTLMLDRSGEPRVLTPTLPRLTGAKEARCLSEPGRGAAARKVRRDWRAFLGAVLPEPMVPSQLVVLPLMPLTPSGKVDRAALPTPVLRSSDAIVLPTTDAERAIAEVWRMVLGVEVVGVNENFFDLGGDSILALQIVAKAREVGVELTSSLLFELHTIRELAAEAGQGPKAHAQQDGVQGEQELTAMQRWTLHHTRLHVDQSVMVTHLRLRRPLELERLSVALERVVEHHDALRLTFDGSTARYGSHGGIELSETALPHHLGLDLARGPVGRLCLDQTEQPPRLTLSLHHLVADGISVRILLEDLERCLDADSPAAASLPNKSTSFQHAALRLGQYARGPAQEELGYWKEIVVGPQASLPGDRGQADLERWESSLERTLDRETTELLLRDTPRQLGVSLDDLLLASLGWALSCWTEQSSFVVDTESHGRQPLFDDVDLSRTVGVFSALYPVRLQVGGDPLATLRHVHRERERLPNQGVGFGQLWYIVEEPSLGDSRREVLFNFLGRYDHVLGASSRFELEPHGAIGARAPDEERPHPIAIDARVVGGELHVRWGYSGRRFDEAPIALAADAFMQSLREMVNPTGRGAARFPLCPFDDATLARASEGAAIADVYPMAPLQQGMLLHTSRDPESGVYRVRIEGTVEGELDEPRLEAAWTGLVAEHPILRTRFVWEHVPAQLVLADAVPRLTLGARGSDRATYSMQGPLTSLNATRLDDGLRRGFRLAWDFHHALLDGWSMMDLLEELQARYRDPSVTFAPRPAYREYVQWLQSREDDPSSLEFFSKVFGSLRRGTPLPTDEGEAVLGPDVYAARTFVLDGAPLTELAREQRVTINTLMQGAWALSLMHWSDERDVVFGAVVPGRPASLRGAERMVGLLMNTLPVRVELDQTELGPWLRKQQQQMVALREHEHMPLSTAQQLATLPPGEPLVRSVISVQGYLRGAASLSAWAEDIGLSDVSFVDWNDLPLSVAVEAGAEFRVTLKHDRRLFSPATASRLAEELEHVLLLLTDATSPTQILDAMQERARVRRRASSRAPRSGPVRRRDRNEKTMTAASKKPGPRKPGPKIRRIPRRRALPTDPRKWVRVASLADASHAVPAVLTPEAPVDLPTWATEQREYVEELLQEHRALLFRGFGVTDVQAFQRVVAGTSTGAPLEYRDRTTPRTTKADGVYTSTVHPPDQTIRLHNEGTYWRRWAQKLYFACIVAADVGGATPIADVRRVYERIDPEIREAFEARGMMLVRNYNDGFGLPWQEVFQSSDRGAVEKYCQDNDIGFEWKDGGRLRTRSVRPAVRRHPRTGEKLWFNHVAFFHWTSLDAATSEALLDDLGEDGLPYNTFYGDGGVIDRDVVTALRRAYAAEEVAFPWEAGDVMLLDNMSVAHARQPFEGEREVLVAMTEAIGDDDLMEL